jgi:hypothetical protein
MRPALLLVVALVVVPLAAPRSLAAQDRAAADRGAVEGTVRGRFDGEVRPLAHALVEAVSGGVRRSAVADSTGFYQLVGLSAGDTRLAVSHAGYAPLTLIVSIPVGGSLPLDLELSGAPVILPAIDVLTDPPGSGVDEPATGRSGRRPISEVDLQALDLGPGVAEAGLLDVVAALPGNDPADATDVLFMRGSTTDLKLVLLDGVPVYTPFHVAGLMRSFEPSVLGGADLHVGGAPARFDGGLTHILDLRTRTPRSDRVRFSGSVDLIAASAAIESPLGEHAGLLLSGRSLHDLGSAPLGGSRPYGYRDVLLTTVVRPANRHEVRATGFWNAESVLLDASLAPDDARWANAAGSLTYRAGVGSALLEMTAGVSGYRAELPLQPSRLPSDSLPPPALLTSAATDRARLVAEVTWGSAGEPVRMGTSFERVEAEVAAERLDGGPRAASRGATDALGAFVDVTRLLGPGVTLRGGARVDHFAGSTTRLAPRAALSWELSREALLTVAAGRYHQPTRTPHVEIERTLAEVSALGVPPGELLPVATADHVVLSLDQRLGERVRLGLEGFWKGFSGLPTAPAETVRSSGVDVRVLTAGEAGAAWLGYGLSWFWSTVDLSGRTSQFMGRHLLSAGVSGALAGPIRGEARLAYGAGLPYTSIPFGTGLASDEPDPQTLNESGSETQREATPAPIVGGLDEEFLRLDLELHMLLEPTVGGRQWQLRPYVRLLNALDQRDALFYTFQPWRSDVVRPLAERPLLPLVGVAISF